MIRYIVGFLVFVVLCGFASAAYTWCSEKAARDKGYHTGLAEQVLAVAVLTALLAAIAYPWAAAVAAVCLAVLVWRRTPKTGFGSALLLSLCQPFALVTYSFHKSGAASAAMGAGFGGPMGPIPSQLAERESRSR